MIMKSRWRKFMLTTHVVTSVGLLGAVATFLLLAVAGLASPDAGMVHAAYPAMALIAWVIIVPLALAALLIGIIESLGTKWGLVRHYWLVVKLVLTVVAIVVLLLQMSTVTYLGHAASSGTVTGAEFSGPRMAMVLHSAGGLLVLLIPMALSVYKPRGRTKWGRVPAWQTRA
jgi:hypothetical protein